MTKLGTLHSLRDSAPSKALSLAETQEQMHLIQQELANNLNQFSRNLCRLEELQESLQSTAPSSDQLSQLSSLQNSLNSSRSAIDKSVKSLAAENKKLTSARLKLLAALNNRADWLQVMLASVTAGAVSGLLVALLK